MTSSEFVGRAVIKVPVAGRWLSGPCDAMGRCCVGTMGRRTVSPLLLLLLVPALVAAATVDPGENTVLQEFSARAADCGEWSVSHLGS